MRVVKLTGNVRRLDVVLDLGDLLLELVERDLGVLDDQVDLEHADTVTDWDELGGTPEETVLLDGADLLLHLDEVGLVVPRLDLEGDDRLGDLEGLAGGELLGLLGLLGLGVLGHALGLDALRLGVVLVVVTEEVDVLVVLLLGGRGGLLGGGGGGGRGGEEVGAGRERGVLGGVRRDVAEPTGGVGVGLGVRGVWQRSVRFEKRIRRTYCP